MESLLVLREKAVRFANEYETWFVILGKFIGMMFVFTYINSGMGYFGMLNSMPVNVLLSLICSIIPGTYAVLISALLILAHLYKLSLLLTLLAAVVMLIIYFLFLRFSPGQVAAILAAPVLMHYHMEYALPIFLGLFLTPYAAVPAAAGIFMARFIHYTVDAASITGPGITTDLTAILAAVQQIFGNLAADREIWVYVVAVIVTAAVVFLIRQFSFDYVWYAAIGAGAIVEIIFVLISAAFLRVELSLAAVVISIVIGAVAAAVAQFFRCTVDYSRKAYVQFEDDDYYYYVKAVPKYVSFGDGREDAGEEAAEAFENEEEDILSSAFEQIMSGGDGEDSSEK